MKNHHKNKNWKNFFKKCTCLSFKDFFISSCTNLDIFLDFIKSWINFDKKSIKLGPWVSNELLHKSFSIFGEIERCVVGVDARGRSTGEAIVEFEKKPCALECVNRCSEGCFFLTTSLRPVIAQIQDEAEDDGGLQESMLPKRNQEYGVEREVCILHIRARPKKIISWSRIWFFLHQHVISRFFLLLLL